MSLISCVNLMVLYSLFISVMYSENCVWEPVQIIKISSMNHFQSRMTLCCLPICLNFCSSLPINRFALAGAILVPMAVPWARK